MNLLNMLNFGSLAYHVKATVKGVCTSSLPLQLGLQLDWKEF